MSTSLMSVPGSSIGVTVIGLARWEIGLVPALRPVHSRDSRFVTSGPRWEWNPDGDRLRRLAWPGSFWFGAERNGTFRPVALLLSMEQFIGLVISLLVDCQARSRVPTLPTRMRRAGLIRVLMRGLVSGWRGWVGTLREWLQVRVNLEMAEPRWWWSGCTRSCGTRFMPLSRRRTGRRL